MTEPNFELAKELYSKLKQEAKSRIEEWKSLDPNTQIIKLEEYNSEFEKKLADINLQTGTRYNGALGFYGLGSLVSNRIQKLKQPATKPVEDDDWDDEIEGKSKGNSKWTKEQQIWFGIKKNCYDCLPQGAGVNYDELHTPKGKQAILKHAKWMDKQFEEEAGMSIEDFVQKNPTFWSFVEKAEKKFINKRQPGKPAPTRPEKMIRMIQNTDKFFVAEKGIGQIFWSLGNGTVEFVKERLKAKHLNLLDLIAKKVSEEHWIRELLKTKRLPACDDGFINQEIELLIDNFDKLSEDERAMFFPKFIVLTENDIRKCQRGNPTSKSIEDIVNGLMTIAIKVNSSAKIFFDNGWQLKSIAGVFCNNIAIARTDNQYSEYQTKRKRRGKGRGYENVYILFFNTRWAAYFFNNLINAQANILPMEFWKELTPWANIIARMLMLYTNPSLPLKIATKALGWSEKTDVCWRIDRVRTILDELKEKGFIVKDWSYPENKPGTLEDTYWNIKTYRKSAFKTRELAAEIN